MEKDHTQNLKARLDQLKNRQEELSHEIRDLYWELEKHDSQYKEDGKNANADRDKNINERVIDETSREEAVIHKGNYDDEGIADQKDDLNTNKSNLERFLGENLISKIGIIILVIGVAIGAKFAVDNRLISPLMRIVLAYMAGVGLMIAAFRLKKRYANYSAVLLSGSMAIFYFLTYLAYSFYGYYPKWLTFCLMIVFTVFTVLSSLKYNRQIIALFGLVGAYAIPVLLDGEASDTVFLFTYIAILNLGILAVSVKKYWKNLFYSALFMTYLGFIVNYILDFSKDIGYSISLIFVTIYFLTFYLTFLANKLIMKEKFVKADILLLLINSFIFYGYGFGIIGDIEHGEKLLGIFTLGNAIIHLTVSLLIKRMKLADKDLFFFVFGLFIVFLTIAIPVELEGKWVVILWAGEAALLFLIGRAKKSVAYEKLSYPMILLSFIGIVIYWADIYDGFGFMNGQKNYPLFLNVNFLTSLLSAAFFGVIVYINRRYRRETQNKTFPSLAKWSEILIPFMFLLIVYFSFFNEISQYWKEVRYQYTNNMASNVLLPVKFYQNKDIATFRTVCLVYYSFIYVLALAWINLVKLKNEKLSKTILLMSLTVTISFLIFGLNSINDLRESYLKYMKSFETVKGSTYVAIRYLGIVLYILLLLTSYYKVRIHKPEKQSLIVFELFVHLSIIWLLSNELLHWMDLAEKQASLKIGLSILWGLYSLFMVVLGIIQKKKHFRYGGMALFGTTLLKLFFYDLKDLDTLSKTITFVLLGVFLLAISFLYNRFIDRIND